MRGLALQASRRCLAEARAACLQQQRCYKVWIGGPNGPENATPGEEGRAWQNMKKIAKENRLQDKWQRSQHYMKPAAQRVQQQKETGKRLEKARFRQLMYWVGMAKER